MLTLFESEVIMNNEFMKLLLIFFGDLNLRKDPTSALIQSLKTDKNKKMNSCTYVYLS